MAPGGAEGAAAAGVTRQQVDDALGMIDGFVEAEMEKTGVPGVAVAVVYDDEVVFAEGYGVREVGTDDAVSADTVFQIASLSKPITGTALAGLVSKGIIDWDEPVHPYAPDLIFSDPWVTDHVTFADLYSHRSGLPGGVGESLDIFGYTRDEILARLRYVPLNPFRATYAYTNFGMTAGGDAAAKAAGVSFEDMIDEQLFEPAGMATASARYADFLERPDRATIHVRLDGEWVPGPTRMPDAQAPAGGVERGGDGRGDVGSAAAQRRHARRRGDRQRGGAPADAHAAHRRGVAWNVRRSDDLLRARLERPHRPPRLPALGALRGLHERCGDQRHAATGRRARCDRADQRRADRRARGPRR